MFNVPFNRLITTQINITCAREMWEHSTKYVWYTHVYSNMSIYRYTSPYTITSYNNLQKQNKQSLSKTGRWFLIMPYAFNCTWAFHYLFCAGICSLLSKSAIGIKSDWTGKSGSGEVECYWFWTFTGSPIRCKWSSCLLQNTPDVTWTK